MTTTDQPSGPHHHDDTELAECGYRPELKRTLGNFHTFAAGISYISILTGTFQLFYFGYASGGAAYWWSWPMVFAGQFMVALCFAELAARYPGYGGHGHRALGRLSGRVPGGLARVGVRDVRLRHGGLAR
jgi:amino acid transporter